MRLIIYIIIIFVFSTLLIDCSNSKPRPVVITDQMTLRELHSGFIAEELEIDIIEHNKDEIVVISTGHLYPLLEHPLAFSTFIDTIISQSPDYVFFLGDLVFNNNNNEWDYILSKFNKIKAVKYFAPGNHDLNYHYERWNGIRENQVDAEIKYINNIGYRYKLVKDNFANYLFLNPNDSLHRFVNYINIINSDLDTSKLMIALTGQSLWHDENQVLGDNHTWMCKAFKRDEILPIFEEFDYLIHGDWGGKYYEGTWPKKNGHFKVIDVGNKVRGDSLFIAKLVISNKSIKGSSINVIPPKESTWFK